MTDPSAPRQPSLAERAVEPGGGRLSLGRPGAGAGRRRHRQDAGADHAHRPYPRHPPRLPLGDPRRHLHQQGGARDEGAHRPSRRRDGRGHALARHLPRDRRAHPAPPCRAGRPEAGLHHPRHRRPDPPDQAAAPGRGHRREALAGPRAPGHRRLEEPRPAARQGAGGGGGRLANGRASSSTPTIRRG
jgi:hypothetical protein